MISNLIEWKNKDLQFRHPLFVKRKRIISKAFDSCTLYTVILMKKGFSKYHNELFELTNKIFWAVIKETLQNRKARSNIFSIRIIQKHKNTLCKLRPAVFVQFHQCSCYLSNSICAYHPDRHRSLFVQNIK